jgi:predicted nuclease of predicted toxin-antitoxin system
MIYLADESVAGPIIARRRADGPVLEAIRETSPGISDVEVLARANTAGTVLLTVDKDFGELVWRDGAIHQVIVLIRLSGVPRDRRADIVSQAFHDRAAELAGAFSVISATGIRTTRTASP